MEAIKAGDAAAIADSYSDDPTVMPHEAEMVRGLAAVRDMWAASLAEGGFTLNLVTVSVEGAGDFAYEVGTWSMRAAEGEGGASEGDYLVVWKRGASGSWKLHTDIWNVSRPAAQ
ncbi:MAG: DUF4440 domain-containing protein [Gemmatimonadota bacterium]|nr:MAG: DUF4440 domain-containing protein [Gemmatimonadota bacterium]